MKSTIMIEKNKKKFLVIKKFDLGNAAIKYQYKNDQRLPGELITSDEADSLVEELLRLPSEFQIFGDVVVNNLLGELKTNGRVFL